MEFGNNVFVGSNKTITWPHFCCKILKGGGYNGLGYHPTIKALAQWAKASSTNKPRVLIGIEERIGDGAIIRTLQDTSVMEAVTLSMHSAMSALDVVKLQEKLKMILLQERI